MDAPSQNKWLLNTEESNLLQRCIHLAHCGPKEGPNVGGRHRVSRPPKGGQKNTSHLPVEDSIDIRGDMATDVPAGIPKTKRPSGPDITLHGDQKIPLLITGVQTTTGKYNGREGRVLLGHIPD